MKQLLLAPLGLLFLSIAVLGLHCLGAGRLGRDLWRLVMEGDDYGN